MIDSRLKQEVRQHWEEEVCGIRYGDSESRTMFFREIEASRYQLESYIPEFADFPSSSGMRVLELGVGAGSDFANWVRHRAHATGIDLTWAGIETTRRHIESTGLSVDNCSLSQADAEHLPFIDGIFNLVWTYGVLHHSPDTEAAFREAFRVLAPGGTLKAMVYHVPSWVGWMLWVRFALLKLKPWLSAKTVIYQHLESPGTKAYYVPEIKDMLSQIGFSEIGVATKLGPGDLLTVRLSDRYRSPIYALVHKIYPRWLVRALGDRFGLVLLCHARKPESSL